MQLLKYIITQQKFAYLQMGWIVLDVLVHVGLVSWSKLHFIMFSS